MFTSSNNQKIQDALSIQTLPFLSAEWNQNLFNAPYVTIAGNGVKHAISSTDEGISNSITVIKDNFNTKKISAITSNRLLQYNVTGLSGKYFKVVFYVKTNSLSPIILNTYIENTSIETFGGKAEEVVSFTWTKIEGYVGANQTLSSFTYNMNFESKDSSITLYDIFYTEPEVYSVSEFDYINHSLWTTESVFSPYRPGESYVSTGNAQIDLPDNFRKVESFTEYTDLHMPCSRVMYNPNVVIIPPPKRTTELESVATKQNRLLKNGMISDMSQYKYFVSDLNDKVITAKYEKELPINKLVIKFNSIIYTPTVTITLTNASGSTSLASLQPDDAGVLVLYWTGSTWSQTKIWNDTIGMPDLDGSLSQFLINQIKIEQTATTIKTDFDNTYFDNDELRRLQIIEISPRLELDISNYLQSFSCDKTLDNKSSAVPISSMEANSYSLTLSAIPSFSVEEGIIPVFFNDTDIQGSLLAGMLQKGVKFYSYYKIENTSSIGDIQSYTNEYIPAGVFYSDGWSQSDIDTVDVQCFDITRILQTIPVQDYAAQLVSVNDIVSNILDFAGFSDYDFDSLYSITHDKNVNMDLAYFFVNAKDTTVFDALRQIFGAYQIAAYVDEYGILRFTSLISILSNQDSVIDITDSDIMDGGYSLEVKEKIGKVSMRYNPPKTSMSASIQNIDKALGSIESPSFYLTTQNDVVWTQQNMDSVGFAYLNQSMSKYDTKFNLNTEELLDIFYTFQRDYDGYAIIEDEIVSFKYKEYTIEKVNGSIPARTVSIKNSIELQAEINRYVKDNMIGIGQSAITPALGYSQNGTNVYDIKVTPTGNITNIQRGLFGSKIKDHNIITTLDSKDLYAKFYNPSTSLYEDAEYTIFSGKVQLTPNGNTYPILIYPQTERDNGYKTYSSTFMIDRTYGGSVGSGIFFNASNSQDTLNDAYFIGLYWDAPTEKYSIKVSHVESGSIVDKYVLDVTSLCKKIIKNTPQVFKVNSFYVDNDLNVKKYVSRKQTLFTLKVVHDFDDQGNTALGLPPMGNSPDNNSEVLRVYLNNNEIMVSQEETVIDGVITHQFNELNMLKKALIDPVNSGTIFGAFANGTNTTSIGSCVVQEIYATEYPLTEPTDSYFHKTQYFLNSIASGRNITYNSYLMQTNPSASGLNYYDVQYTTPAATVVDVLPIEYLLYYQPTDLPIDQKYRQSIKVGPDSAKYSVPINTGFRGKMMIANNQPGLVFLKKDSDSTSTVTVLLNMWTRQIIAPSDEQIIEKVVNQATVSEVAELDSKWIQSGDSAYSILNAVSAGIDGFSKDVSLKIFGNPLLQLGDVVNLSYSLIGVSNQKYIITKIAQSYDGGLETSITLNRI